MGITQMTNDAKESGGVGVLLSRFQNFRSDLNIIQRSIKQGWLIPEKAMFELPEMVEKLASEKTDDGEYKHCEAVRLKAAQVLVLMRESNLKHAAKLLELHLKAVEVEKSAPDASTVVNFNGPTQINSTVELTHDTRLARILRIVGQGGASANTGDGDSRGVSGD